MKKRNYVLLIFLMVMMIGLLSGAYTLYKNGGYTGTKEDTGETVLDRILTNVGSEPEEVRLLREQELVLSDPGHQEYYFSLLNEEEQRGYREMLAGVRARQSDFYLTIYEDNVVDRVYHAMLKDHPELYWAHNRLSVFKTTFKGAKY